MGIYAEYLDQKLDVPQLVKERKNQLSRIAELRGNNDILCYAANLDIQDPVTAILYADLLPIKDQLANLKGDALDVILETPGGVLEIAEDIVKYFRHKYKKVSFIIPGSAKSAGTIMAMSGDEILMDQSSSLGPIDAQLRWRDRVFSADAFLEGFRKIKEEVERTQSLNRAYIPILQNISPGEIEEAENSLLFSNKLVSNWLVTYKFRNWDKHSSNNQPVTEDEKRKRASEIAKALCDHKLWLTHGRSIKMKDLEEGLRLKITDYSKSPDLDDAINRYYTLLQITFDMTNIYKVFETPISQIYRFKIPPGARPAPQKPIGEMVLIDFQCPNCKAINKIQANLDPNIPIQKDAHPFPANDEFTCPNCGTQNNLKSLRFQVESETKKRILS